MDTSATLIGAVEAAVAEYGFDSVTLEQIAARAGLNRATLYRRGHTREALLTSAALAAAEEFRTAALPALTATTAAQDRLTLLAHALFDLADQHLALLAGLFDGPTAVFHLATDDHDALTRLEYTAPFARILADGRADGTLASVDPEEDAEVLFNLLGWTYVHLRRSHGWLPEQARPAVLRQLRWTTP